MLAPAGMTTLWLLDGDVTALKEEGVIPCCVACRHVTRRTDTQQEI